MVSTARHAGMKESEGGGAGGSSTSLNSARLSLIPPFLAAIRGLISACLLSGGVIRKRFLTARPFAEEEPRRHDETGKMRTQAVTHQLSYNSVWRVRGHRDAAAATTLNTETVAMETCQC